MSSKKMKGATMFAILFIFSLFSIIAYFVYNFLVVYVLSSCLGLQSINFRSVWILFAIQLFVFERIISYTHRRHQKEILEKGLSGDSSENKDVKNDEGK